MFFRLARFYTRQDSFGEKYERYNDFTEQRVFAAGHHTKSFYDPTSKRLRPELAAYVDRLRDLETASKRLTSEAIGLRDDQRSALMLSPDDAVRGRVFNSEAGHPR